ncbi:phage head spike fiber domain-containing protein [Falsiroseomonas selenitidurans]|uniref:Uncharacterized protein n=1 Tax=Falsiroseomonas selenitidurans TaxID=2716335 RepID=A0ABX1EF22_9PROT|nr:hypothetical protein [Falsiroseomonas selenitidurans]NKC33505.1 hypothetical protein [Falsiroseomonas selenitidurans]
MLGYAPPGTYPWGTLPPWAVSGGVLLRPVLVAGGPPRAVVPLLDVTVASAGVSAALPAAVPLVAAYALGDAVAVSRAHSPTGAQVASRLAAGGWGLVGQDAARFDSAGRLRVQGPRTNLVANARTPGGTGWTLTQLASATPVTGPDGGAGTAVDIVENTTTNSHSLSSGGITVVSGAVHAQGFVVQAGAGAQYVQISGGGGFGTAHFANFDLLGGAVTRADNCTASITDLGDGWWLIALAVTAASSSAGTTRLTFITSGTAARLPSHTGTGRTVRVWAPQVELAGDIGAPILPPAGSPQASTRGVDVPAWAPAAMPLRGCLVLTVSLDALAGASALGLVQLHDGTDDNRIVVRVAPGGGVVEALVVSAGVTLATLAAPAALAAGTAARVLLAWSVGGVRLGVSGGGIVSAVAARPAGLSAALLGHADAAGALPMGGGLTADFYPVWPSAAEAAALLAA